MLNAKEKILPEYSLDLDASIEQAGADIAPMSGLIAPVLKRANGTPDKSVANNRLNAIHNILSERERGYLLGALSNHVFHQFVAIGTQLSRSPALIVPFSDLGRNGTLLSIHSDGSALIWEITDEGEYAPLPEAFQIDLPRNGSRTDIEEPTHIFENAEGRSIPLSRYLETLDLSAEAKPINGWGGSNSLLHALRHEITQWLDWARQARPVTIISPDADEDEPCVYPWVSTVFLATDEQQLLMLKFAASILSFIAQAEGIDEARLHRSFLKGRTIQSSTEIGFCRIDLDIDDMFEDEVKDLDVKWAPFIAAAFDSHVCPVEPFRQIAQCFRRDGYPMVRGTIDRLLPENCGHPSAHEKIEGVAKLKTLAHLAPA